MFLEQEENNPVIKLFSVWVSTPPPQVLSSQIWFTLYMEFCEMLYFLLFPRVWISGVVEITGLPLQIIVHICQKSLDRVRQGLFVHYFIPLCYTSVFMPTPLRLPVIK